MKVFYADYKKSWSTLKKVFTFLMLIAGTFNYSAQGQKLQTTNQEKTIQSHAPNPQDANFEAKKEAWIKNYPDEYKAVQQMSPGDNTSLNTKTVPVTEQATSNVPEKKWAHAPNPDDPDYQAKKDEWKYNYPEEYNAYLKKTPNPNLNQNVGLNPRLNQPSTNYPQKVAEHAPDINDPAYEVKKAVWIKNYPEEYEQLGGSTTKPIQEKNK